MTKIFHPNVANNGEICVNTLKKDWNPSLGLRHVLIVSLLAVLAMKLFFPNLSVFLLESCLNIIDLLNLVLVDWTFNLSTLIFIINRLLGVY